MDEFIVMHGGLAGVHLTETTKISGIEKRTKRKTERIKV